MDFMNFDQEIVLRAIVVGFFASFFITRIAANLAVKYANGRLSNWIMVLASNRQKKKALKKWGAEIGRPTNALAEESKIWRGTVILDEYNPGHPAARMVDRPTSEIKQGAWPSR